jgi:molybdopterin-binding protein
VLRRQTVRIIMRRERGFATTRHWENAMKISARNVLKGTIVEIRKGATTAHVRIDVNGAIVTASITNESVDDLKLADGKAVFAVIKSSDVMVGVE